MRVSFPKPTFSLYIEVTKFEGNIQFLDKFFHSIAKGMHFLGVGENLKNM